MRLLARHSFYEAISVMAKRQPQPKQSIRALRLELISINNHLKAVIDAKVKNAAAKEKLKSLTLAVYHAINELE